MIIRYGAMIAQASGTLAGVTFSNRRGNAIAAAKSHPCDRKSEAQIAHQAAMAAAAQGWAALSGFQRFNWKLYAAQHVRQNRLGVSRRLSAFQFYLKENILRAQCGIPLRTNPPPSGQSGIGSLDGLIFYAGGPYEIALTAPANDPTGYYAFSCARSTRTLNMGKIFPRFIASYYAAPSIDVDVYTPFVEALGEPPSGEIYWLQIRYLGSFSLASPPATVTQMVF